MYALLVLILLSSPSAFAEKANHQKGSTGNQASQTTQNPHNPDSGLSIGECSNCFDIQSPHTEAERHNAYDARTDSLYRWYLGATIVGVCGGIVGLIFLILQTKATHKAANAARDSAENIVKTERAWIQVKFESREQLSLFQPPPGMVYFWFWPEVINVGRTLARVTKIVVRLHEVERASKHFPGPPFLPETPQYESPDTQVFDKERFVAPDDSIAPFPIPADIEIIDRIKSKEFSVYLYGYVKYLDASDTERETRFCYLYWVPYGIGDPNHEGFHTPGIAPAAYTKST